VEYPLKSLLLLGEYRGYLLEAILFRSLGLYLGLFTWKFYLFGGILLLSISFIGLGRLYPCYQIFFISLVGQYYFWLFFGFFIPLVAN